MQIPESVELCRYLLNHLVKHHGYTIEKIESAIPLLENTERNARVARRRANRESSSGTGPLPQNSSTTTPTASGAATSTAGRKRRKTGEDFEEARAPKKRRQKAVSASSAGEGEEAVGERASDNIGHEAVGQWTI